MSASSTTALAKTFPDALTTVGTLGPNRYAFSGVRPGSHHVAFGPSTFAYQFNGDSPPEVRDSPVLVITDAEILNGVDAVMETGGTLTGTVTGGAQPADGQTVRAYLVGTSYATQTEIESGQYSFVGLTPGTYYLRFGDGADFVWNGDTKDKASSTTVVVPDATTTTANATLSP